MRFKTAGGEAVIRVASIVAVVSNDRDDGATTAIYVEEFPAPVIVAESVDEVVQAIQGSHD